VFIMKKKRLTAIEFQRALSGLNVGAQTIEIARGVLVDGKPQVEFVQALGLSKGAVSQAVNRVWGAAKPELPAGCERVNVVLPEHQAYIVRQWEKDRTKRRGP
jgi:hypothetical protein